MNLLVKIAVPFSFLISSVSMATFLPPNNLHLQDNLNAANMTEAEFNQAIDITTAYYAPIIKAHGATLQMVKNWKDPTVNAYAQQIGSTWSVNMFGGLARRPETTLDGLTLVACHELGHHLGGFPFVSSWAADEGQSDYFATLTCGRNVWQDQVEENAKHRATIDPYAKDLCDKVWSTEPDQDLCYRVMEAGYSLGNLLGNLGGQKVAYNTPDKSKVSKTNHAHPAGQCRLDTYMSGALCVREFDDNLIPKTEVESKGVTCATSDGFELGARPLCWFKPTM